MLIRLNELKARKAARGERVTFADIAEATGINRRTLDNIAAGNQTEVRGEYIDALAAYFGVSPNELIELSPVELPLNLNIRPDRRGVRAGTITKKTDQPSESDKPKPEPPAQPASTAARQAKHDKLLAPLPNEALPPATLERTPAEEERVAKLQEQMRQVEARRAASK